MTGSQVVVGLDVGTTSAKALVMSTDGLELAVGRAPTLWHQTRDGVEADPDTIAAAAEQALGEALSAVPGAQVLAIGVASMAESGVLVDAADRPLAPVIAWHDARDADLLTQLTHEIGGERFSTRTGLPLWTQWSLTKHRWLVDHHEPARGAVRRYNIAEWVVRRLGGDAATELSLASRTGWLDLASGQPWDETLEWSQAPRAMLGDLRTAGSSWGAVPADHPLVSARGATLTVAGHDHQAAVVGAGAHGAGDELDSCGTAEALVRTIPTGLPSSAVAALATAGVTVGWHAVRDRWCVLGATQGGLVLQQVLADLGLRTEDLPALDAEALAALPGAAHLTVSDDGHAVTATGSVRPADRWRAATEAVTAQAARLSEQISTATGPRANLVVTGGWSHSTALMAAKTAALGALARSGATEAGARGAALLAGLAHGTYASYDDLPSAPLWPLATTT
ncbi:FGGY family carbohydrate kinase [Dermatophilaceae bacterium Soc4.6]